MPYPPDYETGTYFFPDSTNASYVSFPAITGITLGGTTPFTVAIWVNIGGFDEPLPNMVVSLRQGGRYVPLIFAAGMSGQPFLSATWSNGTIQSTPTLGAWTYVAVTWDGNDTLTMFLNGAPYSRLQGLATAAVTNPEFQIGCNATQPPPQFHNGSLLGGIRTFAFWTTCLTPLQISTQQWARTALVSTNLQAFCDFTQNPPAVSAGPTPQVVNPYFAMKSYGLLSMGYDTATPGKASTLNPSAASPFSIIAWIAAGQMEPTLSSRAMVLDTPTVPPSPAQGCIFSNADATDPGSLAIWFNNGVATVSFGNGVSVAASAVTVPRYTWTSIAVTYDGATCTIFVNGTAQGSVTVARTTAPTAAPRLLGQLNNGVLAKPYAGMLQFLSVWSVALSAAQVRAWLNEDSSGEPNCVADFACSSNPPQDLVPLARHAIWGENLIVLGRGMQWAASTRPGPGNSGDSTRTRRPARLSAQLLPPVQRVHIPAATGAARDTPELFSAAHRERMSNDFKRAISGLQSDAMRAMWEDEFEQNLTDVFNRASAGEQVSPELCSLAREGDRYVISLDVGTGRSVIAYVTAEAVDIGGTQEYLLTFYTPDGEITSRLQVDITPQCALWWVSFIISLVTGVCMILGVPTLAERLDAIARAIVADGALMAALSTIEGVAKAGFVASTILCFLNILSDFGYMGQIINSSIGLLGWWGATQLFGFFIWLFSPIPNPTQALFIASAVALVATLAVKLSKYQAECEPSLSVPILSNE